MFLENLRGMSCSGTCWPLGGAWFHLSSYCLMFPEFKSSLMFSGFGFKPPASGFQFYFYSSLKTSPSYSTDDKTSRLKMKSFSTLRDTQRGSLGEASFFEKFCGYTLMPLVIYVLTHDPL